MEEIVIEKYIPNGNGNKTLLNEHINFKQSK